MKIQNVDHVVWLVIVLLSCWNAQMLLRLHTDITKLHTKTTLISDALDSIAVTATAAAADVVTSHNPTPTHDRLEDIKSNMETLSASVDSVVTSLTTLSHMVAAQEVYKASHIKRDVILDDSTPHHSHDSSSSNTDCHFTALQEISQKLAALEEGQTKPQPQPQPVCPQNDSQREDSEQLLVSFALSKAQHSIAEVRAINMAQDEKIVEMQRMIAKLEHVVARVFVVVSGKENLDGLRAFYQREAFDSVVHHMHAAHETSTIKFSYHQESKPKHVVKTYPNTTNGNATHVRLVSRRKLQSIPTTESNVVTHTRDTPQITHDIPDFLLLLPTFKRLLLPNNTEYLLRVLDSFLLQHNGFRSDVSIKVLIINNSPTTHTGVEQAVAKLLEQRKSNANIVLTNGTAFDMDALGEYAEKVADDILETTVASRKHTRHVVEVLSKAIDHPAKYVLMWEDDMLFCGDSKNGTLDTMVKFTAAANSVTTNWTALRMGFGGNGFIWHWKDLSVLSDYLLANMHRRPPDHLFTEWYKELTYNAKMGLGDRHRGFTYHRNMFDHIGHHSSFAGREGQGTAESDSGVDYAIPRCFEYNWWLLPSERPKWKCNHVGITPCDPPFV